MGSQSLDDMNLKFLGREHSVADALAALNTVCNVFDKISIDPNLCFAKSKREIMEHNAPASIIPGTWTSVFVPTNH